MPKLPGINHLQAVRALEKVGFRIVRQGKHIVMSDGVRVLTIPRHHPINAFTMGGIVRDAGFTIEEFRELLYHLTPPNQALQRPGGQRWFASRWPSRRSVAVPPPPLSGSVRSRFICTLGAVGCSQDAGDNSYEPI